MSRGLHQNSFHAARVAATRRRRPSTRMNDVLCVIVWKRLEQVLCTEKEVSVDSKNVGSVTDF